ncbi:MAG TPA: hypothetical protein VJR29_07295 [bacterium]|nr:hypothetical protein [bacterium]
MKRRAFGMILGLLALTLAFTKILGCGDSDNAGGPPPPSESMPPNDAAILDHANKLLEEGRQIFRYDTFGSEIFWGDALQLHRAIAGEANGGVGPGLGPNAALEVGLKVDMDALPDSLVQAIQAGQVDLDAPATTLELLKLDAVVGVKGNFDGDQLASVGLRCAICHSTVDDAFSAGIGHRLDGWPNRDLNVGAIIALAPQTTPLTDLLGVDQATLLNVLQSWGPGKFDAHLLLDGQGFRPDGKTAATVIPPAYGLAGVNLHTFEGWGSVPYWNAFVANIEMGGQGVFFDPRLDSTQFPIASQAGFGNIRDASDLITSKLAALHFYQLAIPAPKPPAGSFDEMAAERGRTVFNGKARCASCHVPPLFTEPGWNLHTPAEIGIDDFQANRAPDKRYRTTPLAGLWSRQKGGFYHDGRFPTFGAVVDHYNAAHSLALTDQEKSDLIEYLRSI